MDRMEGHPDSHFNHNHSACSVLQMPGVMQVMDSNCYVPVSGSYISYGDPSQGYPVASFDPSMMQPVMNGEQEEEEQPNDVRIRAALKKQLEYYFSTENLMRDTYLVSQMDSEHYVPITTIASFEQVKKLTHDIDLVVEVLKG